MLLKDVAEDGDDVNADKIFQIDKDLMMVRDRRSMSLGLIRRRDSASDLSTGPVGLKSRERERTINNSTKLVGDGS